METLHEVVLSHFKLTGNANQVGYPQMREAANLSWYMLFKKTRESVVRKWHDVVNGKIEKPRCVENLLGVFTVDNCGDLQPLYEDNTRNTLPQPTAKCTCTKCDMDECMCPTIQDAIVQTEVFIEGQYYNNKTITRIVRNCGDVVVYKEEWVPAYGPDVSIPEVKATASILITHAGETETRAKLFIHRQLLGTYRQGTATTKAQVAAAMVAQFNGVNGWILQVNGEDPNRIDLTAALGFGASLNGLVEIVLDITQVTTGGGGLGTQHQALNVTITQFSGGQDVPTKLQDVILVKTQSTKCTLKVLSCGCVSSCEDNVNVLFGCGCIVDYCAPYYRERYPALYNPYGYYKYDYQTNKINIFDRRGKKTKLKQVMLVYQSNGDDMPIPDYARPALIALLDWTRKQYSPLFKDPERESARRYFARMKNEMIRFVHPIPFEQITQAGDFNAIPRGVRLQSYNNQMLCDMDRTCPPAPCATVVDPLPTTNVINHTTIVNNGGGLYYDFDIADDGWIEAIITALVGKVVVSIWVDGIKRKFSTVAASDVTVPADGTFYWTISTGKLQYRTSLNQGQWVSIEYQN